MVLLVLMSMASTLSGVGSKKCPAAVSATLMTGTEMAAGYVVDVLCTLDVKEDGMKPHEISKAKMPWGWKPRATSIQGFHKSPKLVEIAGAYMMMVAVLTMASTNLPRKAEPAARMALIRVQNCFA